MTAEVITVSEMGRSVHALQDQADVLEQEIHGLKIQLQQLQKQISQKETQRNACLLIAQACISKQTQYSFYRRG